MARASAAFISQAANAGDATLTGAVDYMNKMDLNSADPTTVGSTGALGSKQATGGFTSSAGGSAKTNVGGMSFTTGGATAYGFFSLWNSAGTGYGVGGALGASVTAVTITVAAGAISYLPS
jgi:hypothetical protein